MLLDEPMLRLPIRFSAETLAAEVDALPAEAWVPHPDKLPGNEAVRLITPEGKMTEGVTGTMAPTQYLLACPYMVRVMSTIGAVWGRSRLMRLAPGAVVPPHVDTNFYWRRHVRLHIPILTTPEVLFTCAGQTVHMKAGECWVFDTFARHNVVNGGTRSRVHLVVDTVGSERLWDWIDDAQAPGSAAREPVMMDGVAADGRELVFERDDGSTIMSPWELRYHVAFLAQHALPDPLLAGILRHLDRFVAGWTGIWAQYGASIDGVAAYRQLIVRLEDDLLRLKGQNAALRNRLPVYRQVAELLFNASASLSKAKPTPRTGVAEMTAQRRHAS